MKKHGILNRDIAAILAKLGHTDRIVVADCGLPIPDHVPCIDVSIKQGTPAFIDVLKEVLDDMAVEQLIAAEEVKKQNPSVDQALARTGIDIQYIAHDQLKQQLSEVKAIIRTGENTPYANVLLQAGVIF